MSATIYDGSSGNILRYSENIPKLLVHSVSQIIVVSIVKGLDCPTPVSPFVLPNAHEAVDNNQDDSGSAACNDDTEARPVNRSVFLLEEERACEISKAPGHEQTRGCDGSFGVSRCVCNLQTKHNRVCPS